MTMFSNVGVAVLRATNNILVADGNVGAKAVDVIDDETATRATVKRVANRTIVVVW